MRSQTVLAANDIARVLLLWSHNDCSSWVKESDLDASGVEMGLHLCIYRHSPEKICRMFLLR